MANKMKTGRVCNKKNNDTASDDEENLVQLPMYDPLIAEYKVEVNKVKQIMRDTLYKFKFAVCLPHLFDEKYKLLSELVDDKKELENIKYLIITKYQTKESIDKVIRENTVDFDYANVQDFQNFFNNYVSEFRGIDNTYDELNIIIDFLYRKDNIRELCDKAIFRELPNDIQDLVKAMDVFFNILLDRMKATPREERITESNIAKIFNDSSGLQEQINKSQSQVVKLVNEKSNVVSSNQRKLDKIESDTVELGEVLRKSLEKNTMLYERKMEWDWKVYEVNEKKQTDILKEKKAVLESLIITNTDQELQARTLKSRQYTQLEALINKYDKEMTEKQHYLEELLEKWKKLRLDLAYAEKAFSEQHIIYLEYKNDKLAYEKEIWNKKLHRIKCSIAARKIQRYFRIFLKIAAKFDSQSSSKKMKSRQKTSLLAKASSIAILTGK